MRAEPPDERGVNSSPLRRRRAPIGELTEEAAATERQEGHGVGRPGLVGHSVERLMCAAEMKRCMPRQQNEL